MNEAKKYSPQNSVAHVYLVLYSQVHIMKNNKKYCQLATTCCFKTS